MISGCGGYWQLVRNGALRALTGYSEHFGVLRALTGYSGALTHGVLMGCSLTGYSRCSPLPLCSIYGGGPVLRRAKLNIYALGGDV
jgi:hypothetical protein